MSTRIARFPSFQVFLIVLLPTLILASCARTAPSVKKITAGDAASTVQLKVGDTLEIALEGNPTTGYTWAVASKVPQLQQQGEWEFQRNSNLIGAGGTILLRFKAVSEGEAALQLIYHRVWEKGVPPVKTFEVKVVVGKGSTADAPRQKVELNLDQLDKDGLRGPADGKVAVSYEFCIPNTPECKAKVKAIDRTVQFMPGSRGRIGAGPDECLCIGSTHQGNYREVLAKLAELPCIEHIIECHFE